MVRSLRPEDLEELIVLLRWMDADPSRGVLAPETRNPQELRWETDGGWVLEQNGVVVGYMALYPYRQGGALEGPLVRGPGAKELLSQADAVATERDWHTIYAFPHEQNQMLRQELTASGYAPLHTSYYFASPPRDLSYQPPAGVVIKKVENLDPDIYCNLYRSSEDAWSLRLSWAPLELIEHFNRPDVHLWYAYLEERPVGLVELETGPGSAEVSYLGVIPAARGRGIGRALLAQAAEYAFAGGAPELRVRAHDHEKEAIALYQRLGFKQKSAVVTYAKELS